MEDFEKLLSSPMLLVAVGSGTWYRTFSRTHDRAESGRRFSEPARSDRPARGRTGELSSPAFSLFYWGCPAMTPLQYAGKYRNLEVYLYTEEQAAAATGNQLPSGGEWQTVNVDSYAGSQEATSRRLFMPLQEQGPTPHNEKDESHGVFADRDGDVVQDYTAGARSPKTSHSF